MKFLWVTFLLMVTGVTLASDRASGKVTERTARAGIEEPRYETLQQSGEFELRAYGSMVIAEVQVTGSMDRASGLGFRSIADYIFGNNSVEDGSSSKISMTVPVSMKPSSDATDLTSEDAMKHPDSQWRVSFFMPSQYDLETLPLPNNPKVKLKPVGAGNYAVIRFSGFAGEQKVATKTARLLEWMADQGLVPEAAPTLARYNHPATLPFLRRNEILVRY